MSPGAAGYAIVSRQYRVSDENFGGFGRGGGSFSNLRSHLTIYYFGALEISYFRSITLSSIGDGVTYLRDNEASEPVYMPERQLPAPANLRADGDRIRWDAVSGAAGYRVVVIETPGSEPVVNSGELSASTTDYRPVELTVQVEHQLAVIALGDGRTSLNSDWSLAEISFTPPNRDDDDDDDGNGYVHPTNTPVPTSVPECIRIDSYSRTQEYETLCFDFDLNEMAACVYRRTCTGTCCRKSSTYCPIVQEECGPWQFGQFIRSDDVSGAGGSNGAGEIVDTLEATPENAHDFVGG